MKSPSSNGQTKNLVEGEKETINSELWHACAGPLVSLPPVGSLVVYFPQGHSEQVAASMQKEIDSTPSYPSLPPKLICVLHSATLHADPETDEVYAQMTLQPVNKYEREAILASEMGLKQNKQPTEFFCKTLTASDTSTHGGFSVPRRAAEKIFPPLDFTMQPPAQELVAKDLHDISWTFRHIYRGQPKRHLLTTGWSVFVSTKRLSAGDSVLFIRDEKSQLLLGIRRANRQQPALSSSVLSSDSMHIGILAAAAHAASNNSPFTIFYNPRASPSEFVVPLAKYHKAMYSQVSLGMRFRMMFETEECGVRRYMGTVTGISDLDPVRWKNSQWRNLQVGWDESTATERRTRVSIWEIEPVATPFYICPPPFFRPKFPKQPGEESEIEKAFQMAMPWMNDDCMLKDAQSSIFPGLSLVQWMSMQQSSHVMASAAPSPYLPPIGASTVQEGLLAEEATRLLNFQTHASTVPNLPFNAKLNSQFQHPDQFLRPSDQMSQQPPQLPQPIRASVQQHSPLIQQKSFIIQQQQQHQQSEQVQLHYSQQQQLRPVISQEIADQQLKQHTNSAGQLLTPAHLSSQLPHPSHLQQQNLQGPSLSTLGSLQQSSLPQNLLVQQQSDIAHVALQKQQEQLQQLTQVQLQMQLLQKLQQQQLLPQITPQLQTQLSQQLPHQTQQFAQNLQQQMNNTELLPHLKQLHQPQRNDSINHDKSQLLVRNQSSVSGHDVPSSSSFPSSNHHVSSLNLPKNHGHTTESTVTLPMDNLLQEVQSKPDQKIKHEQLSIRQSTQLPNKLPLADQLDASSATSFCLDGKGHESFSVPPPCLDSNFQVDQRNNFLFGGNNDILMSDAVISRETDSGKDVQKLFCHYGGQKDVETELSTADISSQSFGVADVSFRAGCSSDAAINENGTLSRRTSQPHRMRTYTKVQKRGSVGRCIDVTRYRGYDELRQDLARMFGIEGQLDDPYRSDWKLVYVDHENDILLVGDDPWEEFVSCVQSVKILSAAEVQQMSLDGDLTNVPLQSQMGGSGSNSGNVWRG